ncbi:MAG TPA: hypothetical protein VHQ86_05395 [Candidatus Saccharimonadia bacterium]|nr:hypothetical protein [Candidatus Saccharimonadia bacterium]
MSNRSLRFVLPRVVGAPEAAGVGVTTEVLAELMAGVNQLLIDAQPVPGSTVGYMHGAVVTEEGNLQPFMDAVIFPPGAPDG